MSKRPRLLTTRVIWMALPMISQCSPKRVLDVLEETDRFYLTMWG